MVRGLTVSARVRLVGCCFLLAVLAAACKDSTSPEPLTVTVVTPAMGPLAGGTSVTITGSNFTNVTSVTIGGSQLGNRTLGSTTQITGTTPAAASPGAKDVVVTSSTHGSATCTACFTYNAVSVASVSPASGPLRGGTNVMISGTNFIDVTSVTIAGSDLD